MLRIQFNNPRLLSSFFANIKQHSEETWNEIASRINTNRSMLDNYRKGKILLSEERFNTLLSLVEIKKQKEFLDNVSKKESNWGQIKGGISAYKINKKYFDMGRRSGKMYKGRKKTWLKYNFDINMPLSEELCEFLGVIIGDGCTNKYGKLYQTQISGDKILDKDYYNNLSKICYNLFNINPKIVIRPRGMYFNLYSKNMFKLLVKRFNIPPGIKCYTVKIPNEILKSEEKFVKALLRGMFNTDGGVGFDKRKSYKKPYVRINYVSVSKPLIAQLRALLTSYKIPHSCHIRKGGYRDWSESEQIQINGEKNAKLFLQNIGFSNPRNLNKIAYLLL